MRMNEHYQNARLVYMIHVLAFIGSAISVISTIETIRTRSSISFNGNFCKIGVLFDCSSVYSSGDAVFLGIPVAFYGFIFFSWILFSNSWLLFGWSEKNNPTFLNLGLTAFALLICFYKAFVMIFSIKSLCLLCISMYIVVLGIGLVVYRILGSTRDRATSVIDIFKGVVVNSAAFVLYVSMAILLFVNTSEALTRQKEFDVQAEVRKHYLQDKRDLVISNGNFRLGSKNAPVKLVEFIDLECPYCLKLLKQTKTLWAEFGDAIQVTLVNYPLDEKVNPHIKGAFHQYAGLAAQTAICASMYNKLSEFLDHLLKNSKMLSEEYLHDWVKKQGKNESECERCLQSERVKKRLSDDIADAARNGIDATPFIFVNGRQVNNWYSYELLEKIVQIEVGEKSSDNQLWEAK
jgi:protein-disulfide isomerase/uncharacterized membrane protein